MFRFLHQTEDIMDTELTPTQMAIEFLRRDPTVMTPAQYLKKLKLLELEFADLMALSSLELKKRSIWPGVWVSTKPFSLDSDRGRQRPFFCAWLAASKKIPRAAGKMSGGG